MKAGARNPDGNGPAGAVRSYREVATLMGCSHATVQTLERSAFRKMRRALAQMITDDGLTTDDLDFSAFGGRHLDHFAD